jgi:hypothetical protein
MHNRDALSSSAQLFNITASLDTAVTPVSLGTLGTASGPRRWIGTLRLHAGKYILGVTAPTGTGVQALPRSILSRVLSTHAAGHGTRLLLCPESDLIAAGQRIDAKSG